MTSQPQQTLLSDLPVQLRKRLSCELDLANRHASRMRFSPSLSYGRHFGPPSPTAKQAAVMILLEITETGCTIPLTERHQHLPDHPGQISLPGGRVEADESHLQAACREFTEELGTLQFPGELVGELKPVYVYNSDYFVRPFVATYFGRVDYVPCQREVARVIHLPVDVLADDQRRSRSEYHRGNASWTAETIHFDNAMIWGATAIILGEFARIYQSRVID